MPDILSEFGTELKVPGATTLRLHISQPRTRVSFAVVNERFVPALIGPNYIDSFIRSIHPTERRFVHEHVRLMSILMVHEAKSETRNKNSGTSQEVETDLAIKGTPFSCKPYSVTVAQELVLKPKCNTPVLVSTEVAGLINVVER